MSSFKDLTGQVFGRLTAMWPSGYSGKKKLITWMCVCECGQFHPVMASSLSSGLTKSCGCLHSEISSEIAKKMGLACRTHGHGRSLMHGRSTRTYKSWSSMRARCTNENAPNWASYGGRGITICSEWDSFEQFLSDMGERPIGTTIHRVDNDGNYEPSNCKWATPKEQATNQRKRIPSRRPGAKKARCIRGHDTTLPDSRYRSGNCRRCAARPLAA